MQARKLKTQDWFHPDGFPIALERRDPQEPFGLHMHEFAELVIITGGHGLHVTGRQSWPLSSGDVFVLSGSRPHDYRNMDRLCLINLLFQLDKLRMELHDLPTLAGYHALFSLEPAWRRRHQFKSRLHLTPSELHRVLGYVDLLEEELQVRAPGFGFLATASFMQIVGFLSRCYSRSKNPDSRALLRIAEAITHLEKQYRETMDLDELARIAHMSKRSFLRTFRAATNSSPIAYLIQVRLNHAIRLLRQSNQSITDIAFQVGFNDSNYFTRQFAKTTGMSPRVYRQQCKASG